MKKTINVVVIDDNEVVTGSVKKYFRSNAVINVIETFNKGNEGLDFLLKYPEVYDLVILDLLLPEIDGIRILEELRNKLIKKKVIILSSFKDDYSIRRAQSLGADFYMLKPFDLPSLDARIQEIYADKGRAKPLKRRDVEVDLSVLLHSLGIPSHIRGYKYIREGILLIYESSKIVTLVTKEVYPAIARKFDTTSSRVERAIRHAIEISWSRGDMKVMEKIFGNSIDFDRSKPTNAEYLTTIADRFKIDDKDLVA